MEERKRAGHQVPTAEAVACCLRQEAWPAGLAEAELSGARARLGCSVSDLRKKTRPFRPTRPNPDFTAVSVGGSVMPAHPVGQVECSCHRMLGALGALDTLKTKITTLNSTTYMRTQ